MQNPEGKTVLVIDDEETVRDFVRSCLELEGYHVRDAENGEEGLASAVGEPPDLILCDIHLPGIDGFEALRSLRKDPASAAIPLIVISVQSDRENLRKAMTLGADDFLAKPFTAQELTEAVAGRLERSTMLAASESKMQEMDRNLRHIRALNAITCRINQGLVPDEILNQIFDTFHEIIPYQRIGFALLDDGNKRLTARWARSMAPEMQITVGYAGEMEGSSLQQVMQSCRPRILNDLPAYLREHPDSDSTKRIVAEGFRSSLTCPLIAEGRPIGFIFFSSMDLATYQNMHVDIFLQIAGQLSIIVEKGRLYQKLVELNRVKDRFLGMAAHDLRSPLTGIKGFLDLFRANELGVLNGEQQEITGMMKESCDTMLQLINDLLDVSAIESGHLRVTPEEIALDHFLTGSHETARFLAQPKGITVELVTGPGLPTMWFDPKRVRQALDNLISNAIKFSYPKTCIILGAERVGDSVHFSVSDQGPGIPARELHLLFKDFSRTSVIPTGNEGSSGLGLAIVKRIVQLHGGTVEVESKEGLGSKFTIALPVGHSPALAPDQPGI